MVSRRYYFFILTRISFIALTIYLLFASSFYYRNLSLLIILTILTLAQVALLVGYLNKINKKLELFFIAHLSGEMMTNYTKKGKEGEFDLLYDYFDKVNMKLEKERVENEVKNNYFKTLVDHTSVGLISFVEDGTVGFFNDAAKKLFNIQTVWNLNKLDHLKPGLSQFFLELDPHKTELVNFHLHGEVMQIATRKVTFKSADNTIHLVSLQNIRSQLEKKEVESWQRLIRVLTHEIMNSITPMITHIAALKGALRDPESGKMKKLEELTPASLRKMLKGLNLIEQRGGGLLLFVDRYRDVTRVPKPAFQIIGVRDILLLVHDLFIEECNQRAIQVKVDCPSSLNFYADGNLLQQVFINLFKNALEALDQRPNPMITLTGKSVAEKTVIETMDNGNGIPEEVVDNIFVPFFTTKEKGSGIGLSLSQQIIRLHGGSIDVQSVVGSHTIFTIRI